MNNYNKKKKQKNGQLDGILKKITMPGKLEEKIKNRDWDMTTNISIVLTPPPHVRHISHKFLLFSFWRHTWITPYSYHLSWSPQGYIELKDPCLLMGIKILAYLGIFFYLATFLYGISSHTIFYSIHFDRL